MAITTERDDGETNSNSSGSSSDNTPLIAGLVVGCVAFVIGAIFGYLYKIGKFSSNHGNGRFASYNFQGDEDYTTSSSSSTTTSTTRSSFSPDKSGMTSMQTIPSTEICDEHEIFTL